MTLISWDDFPVYQSSDWIANVATSDRNVYDRSDISVGPFRIEVSRATCEGNLRHPFRHARCATDAGYPSALTVTSQTASVRRPADDTFPSR